MSTVIHCVRHGQGLHNLTENYDLPDPILTPLGEEQCLNARRRYFLDQSQISLITSSPLSRTIHSAALIFRPALETGGSPKTILTIPDAQETSDSPCDVGSDLGVLQKKCKTNGWPVDLSLIQDGWNDKAVGGRYSPASEAIANRARDTRILLRNLARDLIAADDGDIHIVLVTHGGFLHYFTEDWENSSQFPGTGWVNCEVRAYTFEYGVVRDDDADARVVETTDSRRARGLDYPVASRENQAELYAQAMQGWEDQGLQNPSKVGGIREGTQAVVRSPTDQMTAAPCVEVEG